MNKTCSTCRQMLDATLFHKNRTSRDGLAYYCKSCMSVVCQRLRETRRKATQRSHSSDPARLTAWRKKYYDTHRAERIEATAAWQRDNPGAAAAKTSARRAALLQATPVWADTEFICLLYVEAADMSRRRVRGAFDVDHIVPLKSKMVCGLHTHSNVRIIPAKDNRSKSNRFWPDQP